MLQARVVAMEDISRLTMIAGETALALLFAECDSSSDGLIAHIKGVSGLASDPSAQGRWPGSPALAMWYRHFASHRQVEATLSAGAPDLMRVHVCELLFKAGEQLLFSADVPYPEEGLPARWRVEGNTSLQLRFRLSMLAPPVLVGVPLSTTLVRLEFEPRVFRIHALDASWSLHGSACLDSVHAVGYQAPEAGHAFNWFDVRGHG